MFRRIYIFLITFSLFFIYSGCKSIPPREPEDTVTGEEKKSEKISETVKLDVNPLSPVPGNFTVLKIGPLPSLPEIEVKTDFVSDVSLPLWDEGYAYIFLGTGYRVDPGKYGVIVTLKGMETEKLHLEGAIEISSKDFPVSRFSVPASRTEGWTDKKLREAREKVVSSRKNTDPRPLWADSFIWPVKGRISSEFGALRVINGNRRYHAGIDIAEPGGTPVKATNSGIVRLEDHLPAQGKVVIIDHGLNISSSYLHLNELKVTEGQKVKAGEVIGTVGMTGYSTGNHLHWSVHIGDLPVNPEQFIGRKFINPETLFETKAEIEDFQVH